MNRAAQLSAFALAAALAVTGGTSAAAARPHVSVYFVQGEQLAPVTRSGATARDAVRQLIVGGIAFHQFGEVPACPASYGCVRQLSSRRPVDVTGSRTSGWRSR